MSYSAIWIDRETAKIFALSSDRFERKTLTSRYLAHHTHRSDSIDFQRQEFQLFADAAESLKSADKILILGPGVAKHHFRTYLMEQFPALARKVIGCETVDHPSDAQVAALARKFFEVEELSAAN